jgi:hypothetical protein
MVLIIMPDLPAQMWQSITRWVSGGNAEAGPAPNAVEPVFIVEGAQVVPSQEDLPAPNWSLEIASIFTPEVRYWAASIGRWSVQYRIKPNLIAALIQIES